MKAGNFRFGPAFRPQPDLSAPAWMVKAALAIDAALIRLVHGSGALDLALGETLRDLQIGDRLLVLGWSCIESFAVEVLGISATQAYGLAAAAARLEDRGMLRRAVQCDATTLRKAELVAALAEGAAEAAWTWAAMTKTEAELKSMLKEGDVAPPEIEFETESKMWFMSPEQQNRFDRGVSVAQVLTGFHKDRWRAIEAMAMNALATLAEYAPDEPEEEEKRTPEEVEAAKRALRKWEKTWSMNMGAVEGRLEAIEEAQGRVDESYAPDEVPREVRRAALFLNDRAKRLAKARRDREEAIGRLAADAIDLGVPKLLGYGTLDVYCVERLGIAVRSFRQHAWLERKMREMPAIREKLLCGEINLTKARAIAKAANAGNVKKRIAEAKRTTTQETEDKANREEAAKDRKKGVRREWGPAEVMKTLRLAILAVIAAAKALGEIIDGSEAMGRIGDLMVHDNEAEVREMLSKVKPERWEIMMLFMGMCAAPGCRRQGKHVHHIKYRSRGGGEEITNKVLLCARCHLGAVHRGWVELTGARGRRLVWKVKYGESVDASEWFIGPEGQARLAAAGAEAGPEWPESWCHDFAPEDQVEDEGHDHGYAEHAAGGHGEIREPRSAYGEPRLPLRLRGDRPAKSRRPA